MADEPEVKTVPEGHRAASPFSTGGGGTIFELKVGASLLTALLVRAHVPGFEAAVVRELHLQSGHLGYETDDALVVAVDDRGRSRRQLWSVKHEVKYTETDTVFRDVLRDAWADFSNPSRFNPELDVLVLATGPLSATHKHLLILLEFARATTSAVEFETRVLQKGLISQKARDYLTLITKLSNEITRRELSKDEIWSFLRHFHILGFDFDQTGSQDEARFKTLLSVAVRAGSGGTGEDLWNRIFKWTADRTPRAGTFTRESLPSEWQQLTSTVAAHFESGVVRRLVEHSDLLLKRVRNRLGPQLELPRTEIVDELCVPFLQQPLTLVSGSAGVGKSAAARKALEQVRSGAPLFVFQATEFARDHLDHALSEMRITESLSQISALFALHPHKFLLIESVERLLESTRREAFFMLLSKVAEDPTWRAVLTCRQHAVAQIQDAFLAPLSLSCVPKVVTALSNQELDWVLGQVPVLKRVTSDLRTRDLLRNPWFLDKACSVNWEKVSTSEPLDQKRLRDILWNQVIARDDVRENGINLQRDAAFRAIAVRRARSLGSFLTVARGEEAAVQALIADELLVQDFATGFVAPSHDVLEDWALVRWVADLFATLGIKPESFFEALGHEFSIRRSYRQWLEEVLVGHELGGVRGFVDKVLTSTNVPSYWKDETIVSVLLSHDATRFIEEYETRLGQATYFL